MADAESTQADNFIAHQEAHQRDARCGEMTSWCLHDNIEACVQVLTQFEGPEGPRSVNIPDDPYVLDLLMHELHARADSQCKGHA